MTGRERILTTLEHREPDRVPFDLGSMGVTGIHVISYRRLRHYLGLGPGVEALYDPIQQLALVEEDMAARLAIDARPVTRRRPPACIIEGTECFSFCDEW